MATQASPNLVDARLEAERLSRVHEYEQAKSVLLAALLQAYASEEEYAPAVRVLGKVLGAMGDARGALTCWWYAGEGAAAKVLLDQVPESDRALTLAAQAMRPVADEKRKVTMLQEAATAFESSARIAQAAVCREKAEDYVTARGLWSRLCQRIGGGGGAEGDLYAAGLARFNLGRVSLKIGDKPAARDAIVSAVHLLEQAADRYESIGQRERAFDCYHVLVAIGRESNVLEHVLEGYVNLIRILREDQLRSHALQSYEEAIAFVRNRGEIAAAATLAREMDGYARRQGMPAVANQALLAQAEMWREVAQAVIQRGGPAEIAENALLAAVLCYGDLGQFRRVGDAYQELAHLPLEKARRAHYSRAAGRYEQAKDERVEAAPWTPTHPVDGSFPDVWHIDLVEWEQKGSACDACADILLSPETWSDVVRRRGLVARLTALHVEGAETAPAEDQVRLVQSLEPIELYSILSPLERLAGSNQPAVRAAVARALGRFLYKRTFIALRRLLGDPDASVRGEANRALEQLRFPHAFDPLARLYRESTQKETRLAALRALAHVDTDEAAEMVVGVLQHSGPDERDAVLGAITGSRGERLAKAAAAAIPGASKEVATVLQQVSQARVWWG